MGPDDDHAFMVFAVAAIPRLRRMAFAWTHDWASADDAVQGALENMVRSWHRLDDRDPYFYARSVLMRLLISEARKPWRRHERLSGLDYAAHLSGDHHEDGHGHILAELSTLSPKQRSVMILRFIEDLSVTQTAKTLGCSEGNVKRHTYDARQRLAVILQDSAAIESSRNTSTGESRNE
jgi:RNA polymerase sigma factor (sigma-70 family)